MKNNYAFFIILFMIQSSLKAQDFGSKSTWPFQPIVIDGRTNEWEKPLNFYNNEAGMTYSISNDSAYLYLSFICNNAMKSRKMMRAGWEIELISKEKNKKFKATLTFPVRKQNANTEIQKEDYKRGEHQNISDIINTYKLQLGGITGMGFKTLNGEIKINDLNGIQIAVGEENAQGIAYEIAIPIKELMDLNLVTLTEELTMKVHINALDNPNFKGGQNGGASQGMGGQGMGSGGMGGSGMGGGRMGGGGGGGRMGSNGGGAYSADRSALFENVNFKLKFRLSSGKPVTN